MALDFKDPINQLIKDFNHGILKELFIFEKEQKEIQNLQDILISFYKPTIILQERKYPTLSLVLPLIKQVYKVLLDLKQLYIDEYNLGEEDGVSNFLIFYFIL